MSSVGCYITLTFSDHRHHTKCVKRRKNEWMKGDFAAKQRNNGIFVPDLLMWSDFITQQKKTSAGDTRSLLSDIQCILCQSVFVCLYVTLYSYLFNLKTSKNVDATILLCRIGKRCQHTYNTHKVVLAKKAACQEKCKSQEYFLHTKISEQYSGNEKSKIYKCVYSKADCENVICAIGMLCISNCGGKLVLHWHKK